MAQQEYDNELRGSMFRNDRKTKDNQPDYRGSAQIEGVEYWVSAWVREGKTGPFLSMSYTAKDSRGSESAVDDVLRPTTARNDQTNRQQPSKQGNRLDDFEDDIPF